MDESAKFQYWMVQLGNLYYAGGLARKSPEIDAFSFEFVSDASLAFPFIAEVFANKIAAQCGGVVVILEATPEEYSALYDNHNEYINSEAEWHKEQELSIREEIMKQTESEK